MAITEEVQVHRQYLEINLMSFSFFYRIEMIERKRIRFAERDGQPRHVSVFQN